MLFRSIASSHHADASANIMNNISQAQAFIERWQGSSASELSTAQCFVRELCALRGVDVPHTTPGQGTMHALCQQAKAAHRFC